MSLSGHDRRPIVELRDYQQETCAGMYALAPDSAAQWICFDAETDDGGIQTGKHGMSAHE
jgi:hypothetical protein